MARTIIEFHLTGKPASVNGSTERKNSWKDQVYRTVTAMYSNGKVGEKLTLKVFYFPHNQQYCDVDNGLKYTIDGMAPVLMTNDRNVTRIIAERFPKSPGASLVVSLSIAPYIANLIAMRETNNTPDYITLVKLEEYECNGGNLW
ncbi:RusA family crossover junction endodeoxyribonuclease [Pantoea agglomerans]|uniref:RusA family crossover junction endodeoxyribonuclease n=1 Tax=Enterobacter agglomerans TaxID=549 RepID=UPI001A91AC94|nr:RusA family crossover junction endodeoxyribonuclease [Pantoea agglomerans]MBO0637843.1 RusA family crossover junction endodeoxyribonuclease [Pantoea agglomerans]